MVVVKKSYFMFEQYDSHNTKQYIIAWLRFKMVLGSNIVFKRGV